VSDAWRRNYRKYLRSREWRYLKARVARVRGRKCERCGNTWGLSLHHRNYHRLGHELTADVELLCKACHARADLERAYLNCLPRIPQEI
jgi:hypothetical protein